MKSQPVSAGDNGTIGQYNNLIHEVKAASWLSPRQQDTPGLTLYVEEGNFYINNTLVSFAGGNSPSFTAPATNPRIDVLSINSSGTLVRTKGTESATPVAPYVPDDNFPICQVYNRVGQTIIYNTDQATNGYVYKDIRVFLSYEKAPSVSLKTTTATSIGSSSTQFDITNPSGTTFRYTYDGTGTDPSISAANNPVGSVIAFRGTNMNTNNEGAFVITASGSNYVEVINANGVVESNKTIGSGFAFKATSASVWTKPERLRNLIVKVASGGVSGAAGSYGSSVGATGGASGGISIKTIPASSLPLSVGYIVGGVGFPSIFGSIYAMSNQGAVANGDINVIGSPGFSTSGSVGGNGASSMYGNGGVGGGGNAGGYASGGGGGNGNGPGNPGGSGGTGTQGVIEIQEHYL